MTPHENDIRDLFRFSDHFRTATPECFTVSELIKVTALGFAHKTLRTRFPQSRRAMSYVDKQMRNVASIHMFRHDLQDL